MGECHACCGSCARPDLRPPQHVKPSHDVAFAPLSYAVGRLTWLPGLLLLVGMWAASYYNAMLLVRCLPRRTQLRCRRLQTHNAPGQCVPSECMPGLGMTLWHASAGGPAHVDGHDAAVPLPRPRQEHLGCAAPCKGEMTPFSITTCCAECVYNLATVWSRAVGAGDKGLYTVYIFQLTGCISKNVAVQLACAFAMKVRGCDMHLLTRLQHDDAPYQCYCTAP